MKIFKIFIVILILLFLSNKLAKQFLEQTNFEKKSILDYLMADFFIIFEKKHFPPEWRLLCFLACRPPVFRVVVSCNPPL